ncbi:tetratricopeptide repeat protein [Myxococcus llanfairpwllgwyngyllgogerychwyrndrobwllllantysiliogogogochensis]|uniref:Tetratricopeptide repeat protein n=1 Tax=Myxococcus llanfairpwllgwyngyllgogerychwyrndrobwllllantysiliogogogochensis TaxID=2590453 RepID=A0A540WUW8_9BACT|nr:tetratricopeptide repeat protein [Myxococcus llanfairpwllgwyngyllgogerychwyrndrobwllllantysiliogogogochensis]TQF12234.1 tetratricopeptide repeat protein [Myxococcus llanfairpwllgwyngyllgogerychwyrndrobwllllantysiliogogogochensis]
MTRDTSKTSTGMMPMKWFRSLVVGSLAFTAGCASGPQQKPSALPTKQAPSAPASSTTPSQLARPEAKEASASDHFTQAIQAYEAGDLDAARQGFEKVLAKSPQSLNSQFNLGVIAERQGRVDDARNAYEKVLLLEPAHTPSVVNLASVYRKQERGDDAIALFEKALKAPGHAHDAALLNGLSATYRQLGKLDQSELTARRVLERNKDHPDAYKNLAYVAYAREKYRLAELLVGTARKHAEKDPSLYNLLGMVYLKLDERPRALAQFQKAVSLDEKYAPGHLNLGALALSYRDYAGAERAFTRALELEPDSTEARLSLAWALDGQKGRDSKKGIAAGEAFEKVLANRADLPEAVCGAGWAFASDRTGWERAVAFLDRCKSLESTTEQERQMITAKVQGLQNMLKAPPPEAATAGSEGEKKDEATGGAGSMLNQLPQDANAPTEATPPPAEGAGAAEGATTPEATESAPAEAAQPSGEGTGTSAPAPVPAPQGASAPPTK